MNDTRKPHRRIKSHLGIAAAGIMTAALGISGGGKTSPELPTHLKAISPADAITAAEKRLEAALDSALMDLLKTYAEIKKDAALRHTKPIITGQRKLDKVLHQFTNYISPSTAKKMEMLEEFKSGITLSICPPTPECPQGKCYLQLTAFPGKCHELVGLVELLNARKSLHNLVCEHTDANLVSEHLKNNIFFNQVLDRFVGSNPDYREQVAKIMEKILALHELEGGIARPSKLHVEFKVLDDNSPIPITIPITITNAAPALGWAR